MVDFTTYKTRKNALDSLKNEPCFYREKPILRACVMKVETQYYDDGASGGVESFHKDILTGLQAASRRLDHVGAERLADLWLIYLEEQLGCKSAQALERYVDSLSVWRWFGTDPIIKTMDTPCVAFTLFRTDESLVLIAIGACYNYPQGGETAWWDNVILPRLRRL